MIKRAIEQNLISRLDSGKALIIYGPRQSGKTTLLRSLLAESDDVRWLNGDEPDTRLLLEDITSDRWLLLIGKAKTLVIDEAQRIENIGLKLKLLIDLKPGIRILATGSSSFELANKINEPLTGRKWEYRLFPISFGEMVEHQGWLNEKRALEQRLVFGSYPEIVSNPNDSRELLNQLADSYLYKDVLSWNQIKKSDKLVKLLQAIAYQLGQEVSWHELGQILDLNSKTVETYVQILEQAFIIFRLPPLSRNLRKELKRKRKIYFYDNGIRNAIIAQFEPLALRQDVGRLWENWIIAERMKLLSYQRQHANTFFWRTQDRQEIDYIEERDGKFYAYEFKWNPKAKARFPKTFTRAYPAHVTQVIHRDNFEEFLGVNARGLG